VSAIGNGEPVVLGEGGQDRIAARVVERLGELFVIVLRDSLEEEQQWKDVRLEVSDVDWAAKDVDGPVGARLVQIVATPPWYRTG